MALHSLMGHFTAMYDGGCLRVGMIKTFLKFSRMLVPVVTRLASMIG